MKIRRMRTECWISMAISFSTATVVTRTPLNFTLYIYIYRLSFFFFNSGWRYSRIGENLHLRCCQIQISDHSYIHIHKVMACFGSELRHSVTGQTFVIHPSLSVRYLACANTLTVTFSPRMEHLWRTVRVIVRTQYLIWWSIKDVMSRNRVCNETG
jgi:hypothetical protein